MFRKTKKLFGLIAAFAMTSTFSPGLLAQDESLSVRENSLFTDGVNLPASPQAWAMNRYGNETVNLYSGTVGANIPIYTYSDNDFTLPVSINYSSDGYRPNIQSGPLGLGWNLSLGGAITREVRGIPDDSPTSGDSGSYSDKGTGFRLYPRSSVEPVRMWGFAHYHQADSDSTYMDDLVYCGKLGEDYMHVKRLLADTPSGLVPSGDCYELTPDIFHFTAPGLSGSFVLQGGGSAVFYDMDGSPYGYEVSHEMSGTGFMSFEITTPDRYVYTYSQVDWCTSESQLSDTNNDYTVPGSWRLTRIEAPDGRYVTYSYGETNWSHSCQYVSIHQESTVVSYDAAASEGTPEYGSSANGAGVSSSRTRSDCLTRVQVCNSDGTAVCTMDLTYVSGVLEYGADNHACRKLSSVTVKNISGRTVRHCVLSYDVVYDPVMRSNGVTFLKSVSVDGEGTTVFSYYGNDSGEISPSTRFPKMTTASVDWYGYYNPAVTEQNFAPSLQSARNNPSESWLQTMRRPDLDGTRLGMLRSITYPTGGSATYEYELNSYSENAVGEDPAQTGITSGLRVKSIVLRDSDGRQMQRRSFSYLSGLNSWHSSGRLLQKPVSYISYKLRTSGFARLEREAFTTTSDLYYGAKSHVEYTRVVETISKDGSADVSSIVSTFTSASSASDPNGYGDSVASYTFLMQDHTFNYNHTSPSQRAQDLFSSIRTSEECIGGGRILSRTEYCGTTSGGYPVSRKDYEYEVVDHDPSASMEVPVFVLSFRSSYTYRFHEYKTRSISESTFDTGGNLMSKRTSRICYDGQCRPVSVKTPDSQGDTLSTRYTWDSAHPWLLLEKSSYRGELMMSGVQYSWQRPSASSRPDWYVPQEMKRAAITLAHGVNHDSTNATWHRVAIFSGFNAVGNPTVVRDAMNHETRYTWDASGLNLTSMTQYPGGSTNPGLTTRWTWIPLVGATSITRPSGKVERYAYDQYGRLESAANTANATLAQYGYHITGSPDDHSWTRVQAYRTASQSAEDVTFYNGLGYPEQSNSVGAGGGGYDIITPYTCDALLRPEREWLPFATELEDEYEQDVLDKYLPDVTGWQLGWYQELYGTVPDGDDEPVSVRPYSRTISEFSPSGRPLTSMLPGEDYDLHPTTFEYLADTIDGRAVTGVKTTDGDGRIAIEWKDYEDRTVAQDRFLGDTLARTLYRYDWRGNLTEVVTPEGNTYNYTYDGFSRVISKKIPGKEIETYSYDILDRLVRSTDGNQRSHEIGIEYTYDDLGRETGRYAHLENEETDETRPMAEYFYSPTTGLKTSERIYQLTADGYVGSSHITRNFTYDNEERVTRVEETESGGDYTLTTVFTYDLAGNVLTSTATCEKGNGDRTVILTARTYDSRSRLTGETVSVDGVQKSVTAVSYDELGRPRLKTYGSGSGAISESTTYTIQGWTSTKWNNLMHMEYSYEGSAPNYRSWTGNITQWNWTHMAANGEIDANGNPASYQRHSESFVYDGLNRLKGSEMTIGSGSSATTDNRWSERNIRYDLEGNILHLDRYQSAAATPETSLNFTYTDSKRNGYRYDSNGNITFDPLRSFEIRYNLLNLASEVTGHDPEDTAAEGTQLSETVYYADGTRAGVMNPEDGYWTSRYIGSLIYEGEPGEETLDGIQTADGFIAWNGGAQNSRMQYFLRDHLGSVRVIASDRNTVISRSDYLPFGVRMTGNGLCGENSSARSSYFGFSGKENEMWDGLDAMSGNTPHWLKGERYQHFGARAYDPVTCIFMQIDPMAEKYYGMTPYHYCAGNPVMFVDPDGLKKLNAVIDICDNSIETRLKYYRLRYEDAIKRGVKEEVARSYYIDYGEKYMKEFYQHTYNKLSEKGQTWLMEVLVGLQNKMENFLVNNFFASQIESCPDAFFSVATNQHVGAYKNKSGTVKLTDLTFSDLSHIFTTVENSDLVRFSSMLQVSRIGLSLSCYWIKHPDVLVQRIKEASDQPELISEIFEKLNLGVVITGKDEIREFIENWNNSQSDGD